MSNTTPSNLQAPAQVRTRVGMLPEPLAALLQSKRLILGKYRLEHLVGRGGMSVVFAAEHTMLRKRVAIKFLSLDQCESGSAVARFLHEGRSAARIRSEHVARVIDVDTIPGGIPCMVLEYLEGYDLAYTLKQRGALPMELAVDYVMQALEALAEAHTLNIVHRDLKPSNLFVVRRADGRKDIKVIDFGISKSIGDSEETGLTKRHSLLGSPEYMSPEQAQGEVDVDTRTDIWSMGVVLYELLCASCPFEGADYMEILGKVTRDDPPSISEKCPHVPPPVERIIRRCLERDRDKRFQTVGELAAALLPFGSERARFSYDSILGVCKRAEQGPASSTMTGVNSPMPNEDLAREEWKQLGTADFACAVDQFVPSQPWSKPVSVDLSDEAPTKRSPFTPVPAPPAAVTRMEPHGEKKEDDARRPLISVVRGKLPSLTELGPSATSSIDERWLHRAEVREKHAPRQKPARGDTKRRSDLLLWALCLVTVIAAGVLLADQFRSGDATASAATVDLQRPSRAQPAPESAPVTPEPSLADIRMVPKTERSAQPFITGSATLAPMQP